ncbi:MAG: mechanosensitive ion channel family protein [Rhodocyclaceae bacterium]|nr:mechanosensitive ion channel family protein [Rhodocyclaceae bacterium]
MLITAVLIGVAEPPELLGFRAFSPSVASAASPWVLQRDLLANFFGGLMVYLDRPFAIGDWIRSPDRNIEGTVERSAGASHASTFDKRPLYVPNAVFTQIAWRILRA